MILKVQLQVHATQDPRLLAPKQRLNTLRLPSTLVVPSHATKTDREEEEEEEELAPQEPHQLSRSGLPKPDPSFMGCWHCGKDKCSRRACREFKATLKANDGKVPPTYVGAFERHLEKQCGTVNSIIPDNLPAPPGTLPQTATGGCHAILPSDLSEAKARCWQTLDSATTMPIVDPPSRSNTLWEQLKTIADDDNNDDDVDNGQADGKNTYW